jgi:hypothetical protein
MVIQQSLLPLCAPDPIHKGLLRLLVSSYIYNQLELNELQDGSSCSYCVTFKLKEALVLSDVSFY